MLASYKPMDNEILELFDVTDHGLTKCEVDLNQPIFDATPAKVLI